MQFHHRSLDQLFLDESAVTIGSFDGVHLGHQLIVKQLLDYAKKRAIPSVVVTFFPHPMVVLRQIEDPFYLTFPDQRAALLFDLGVDHVVTVNFTRDLSEFSPEAFMGWIHKHLKFEFLCIGQDFALGRGRKGNPETLSTIGESLGYQLKSIQPMLEGGEKISSSRIRKLLRAGNIEKVNALLGRHFFVEGLGGEIQDVVELENAVTPISLTIEPLQLVPARGVYAAVAYLHKKVYPAIIDIEELPLIESISKKPPAILLYLIDFDEVAPPHSNILVKFLSQLHAVNMQQSMLAGVDQFKQDIQTVREVFLNGS